MKTLKFGGIQVFEKEKHSDLRDLSKTFWRVWKVW